MVPPVPISFFRSFSLEILPLYRVGTLLKFNYSDGNYYEYRNNCGRLRLGEISFSNRLQN